MVGRTISHYRVVAHLGTGGMGVLYRADDLRLGRQVALKFVSEELAHDEQSVLRLRSEARAASALNHGNICTIYDIDEVDGHPFIVMELLKGETLRDRRTSGRIKIHQLVDIGIEIADALHAAHSEGIIHRDIKPSNIFLTDRGRVKLLDFGLAKSMMHVIGPGTTRGPDATGTGITLGTISHMSPEQATGEELDGRTDLFSLGVVLYECATGQQPFPGKTTALVLEAILHRTPIAPAALNPELPLRLQEVINTCLEKDRELRYQSAAEVRADLKRVRRDIESGHSHAVAAAPATARPSGPKARSRSRSDIEPASEAERASAPRARLLWIGAWIGAAALVAAGAYGIWLRPRAVPAAPGVTVTDTLAEGRLKLAQASLDGKNYRVALAYADEVLAFDAGNQTATTIRDEARKMIARYDAAIAQARDRLGAGDVAGTTRALEAARALDPTAPAVTDVSLRLAEFVRGRERDADARDAAARARSASASSSPSVPPPRHPQPGPSGPSASSAPPAAVPATGPVKGDPVKTDPVKSDPVKDDPVKGEPRAEPSAVPPQPAVPAPVPPPVAAAPSQAAPKLPAPAAPSADEHDAAIRKAVASYGRAIEGKDIALFRSIKPNLSVEEERRLKEGFRAVTSQRVVLTVLSIDARGETAVVRLRRQDTIQAGGRRQTADSEQTLTLVRAAGGWIITDIQ